MGAAQADGPLGGAGRLPLALHESSDGVEDNARVGPRICIGPHISVVCEDRLELQGCVRNQIKAVIGIGRVRRDRAPVSVERTPRLLRSCQLLEKRLRLVE